MCTGDINLITIQGNPEPKDLYNTWLDIVAEYSSFIKSDRSKAIISLQRRIGLLQWKIIYIDYVTQALLLEYHNGKYRIEKVEALSKMLKSVGYPIVITKDNYIKAVNGVISRAKTLIPRKQELEKDYLALAKESGDIRTREDYLQEVARLSKFMGYRIDISTTSTEEVAVMFNAFIEDISSQLKKQPHGQNR